MFSSRFMLYFQHLKKEKFGVKKTFPGGEGGGVDNFFFLENQFFLISVSRFMLFSTL